MTISTNKNRHSYSNLNAAVKERSRKTLERFGDIATSQVKDTRLLAILKEVKDNWKDTFRPALTSFSCEAVGGEPEVADGACLMLTLAASGFGLHDDILDKSLGKHMRNTILGLHGNDSTLLVGDLLMFEGWSMVHEMIRKARKPEKIADIIRVYGSLCVEICEAEFMETLCRRNLEISVEYYQGILWKAMAEIEACSRIGAMMGDGKEYEIQALAEFGRRLGFVFRLGDDIEDCLNLKGDLIHRLEFESVPLPLLYTAKSSNEKFSKIRGIIENPQITPSDVRSLVEYCFEAEAFEYVRKIAEKNEVAGARVLRKLKPSAARTVLLSMIKASYDRIDELCR